MKTYRTKTMFSLILFATNILIGCGDDNKGRPLNIPLIKPPVDASTPSGLSGEAAALHLQNCNESGTPLERLKSRIFCEGPGDFRYRLGMVDNRMAELSKRSEENAPVCVDEVSKLWDVPLPGDESFPMHFSCFEAMGGSELRVFFGESDDHFYMAELQNPGGENFESTNAPDLAVLAKVNKNGDQVTVWQILFDEDQKSSWLKVEANASDETIELLVMGSTMGYGVGCGVNLKANADSIYVDGIVNDADFPGGCEGFQGEIDLRLQGACVDAVTLEEKDAEDCVSAGIDEFTFSQHKYEDVVEWDSEKAAGKIIRGLGLPSNLTDFSNSQLGETN